MKIEVCTGKTCKSKFSEYIMTRLENDKKFYNLKNLDFFEGKCTGNCAKGPTITVDGKVQTYICPSKASEIAQGKVKKKKKSYNNNKKK